MSERLLPKGTRVLLRPAGVSLPCPLQWGTVSWYMGDCIVVYDVPDEARNQGFEVNVNLNPEWVIQVDRECRSYLADQKKLQDDLEKDRIRREIPSIGLSIRVEFKPKFGGTGCIPFSTMREADSFAKGLAAMPVVQWVTLLINGEATWSCTNN